MIAGFLQLIFALAFLALACILTYKITLPLGLKIIDLCFDSEHFRIGVSILLAMVFCAIGVLQLKDFLEEPDSDLSRFFLLSFFVSGIFLFLGFRKRDLTK